MQKFLAVAAAAVAIASVAAGAQASVVTFSGSPASSWADGAFTTGLGPFPDGFYSQGPTSAYNGYGQDDEEIFFNAPVTLNSLSIGKCGACYDSFPSFYTVNLFNAASAFIGSQSAAASLAPTLLTFNTAGVKTIQFTFSGQNGTTPYGGDTRHPAWYAVSDITYGAGTPEPATWALMISGFGLAGAALRRRRTAIAA